MARKSTNGKQVDAITHPEDKRKNIPTAEYHPASLRPSRGYP
jgi:hypothetical protein